MSGVGAAPAPRSPAAREKPSSLRLRFPKSYRLRRRSEFLRVQESSARITTAHFVLLVAPRLRRGPCRLGVVASKKIGGAVERNRAKRLIREVFRTLRDLRPEDVDLVIIARPGAPELTLEKVRAELERAASVVSRRAREVTRK